MMDAMVKRVCMKRSAGVGFTVCYINYRDCNHKATSEFVDVIFIAAYKRLALLHHCNNTFYFYLNKVLQETSATRLSPRKEIWQYNNRTAMWYLIYYSKHLIVMCNTSK